jgi:hypothetical protein
MARMMACIAAMVIACPSFAYSVICRGSAYRVNGDYMMQSCPTGDDPAPCMNTMHYAVETFLDLGDRYERTFPYGKVVIYKSTYQFAIMLPASHIEERGVCKFDSSSGSAPGL